ncbi:TspO/MBR family-domain-containing protein [Cladochytrium replicatum]|nr:TspO/MBR family-domain-containing protein [Cladochytrium replicatum]
MSSVLSSPRGSWGTMFAFVSLPVLGGFASAFITRDAVKGWYKTLSKPSWTPPNWLFGPAWTTLYTLMGVSSYIIYTTPTYTPAALPSTASDALALVKSAEPLALYALQLSLNFAWSPIMFGAKKVGAAGITIAALWTAIIATTRAFWKVNPTAGKLMLPYIAWVSYASALNGAIWWLNYGPGKPARNRKRSADGPVGGEPERARARLLSPERKE